VTRQEYDALYHLVNDWRWRQADELVSRDPGWVGAEAAFGVCVTELSDFLMARVPKAVASGRARKVARKQTRAPRAGKQTQA
jgi:hypothetical protein